MDTEKQQAAKQFMPENAENYKKAISAGLEMAKAPDDSKADVARKIFESIHTEKREVIAQALIDSANLNP